MINRFSQRFSQRRSDRICAAAVGAAAAAASIGLVGFSASRADANLFVDVRPIGITGGVIHDPKHVEVSTSGPGATLTLGVFARITGANSVQTIGNYDNAGGNNDTRNDDSLGNVTGSFNSVGALKGDYDPTNNGAGGALVPNFVSAGVSQIGVANDWDGDGDLDIGAADVTLAKMWAAYAGNPTYATRFTGNIFGADRGLSPPFGIDPLSDIINASTSELHLGTLTWVVTGGSGQADLNFIPRPDPLNPASVVRRRHRHRQGPGERAVGR